MNLPAKAIAVIGLIQVVTVMSGFLISRAFRRLWNDTSGQLQIFESEIHWVARVIQAGGFFFLAVPLVWVIYTCWKADRSNGTLEARTLETIIGWILSAALFVFFAIGIVQSIDALSPKKISLMNVAP